MQLRFRLFSILYIIFSCGILFAQYSGTVPFVHENGGLIINEISNGVNNGSVGNRAEYIELLVVGSATDPTAPVNLEGWIIDDNNFPAESQGTAPGHSSFGSCYAAMPPGSIIVFYNADDRNVTIPPDDPDDTNPQDGVYIVSHKDPCINTCYSNPIPPTPGNDANPTYCPCADPDDTRLLWALGLSNDNDLVQIRDRCETVNHVIYWDAIQDIKLVEDVENSPTKVKVDGNQRELVILFTNSVDNNWSNPANFENLDAIDGQSPGSANSPENQLFIDQLKNGTFIPNGTISDCKDTDAGDLVLPNNAGADLPIILTIGDDIGAFRTDYSAMDENAPDALDFNFEYAYILTQNDAPNYTIVDYNASGDFNFRDYPAGEYLLWGFSYIQTNGTVNVGRFLANIVTNIQDILNYKECGFDSNLDNLTASGEPIEIIIEEAPCFDTVSDVKDNNCPNENIGAIEISITNEQAPLTIDWNVDEYDGDLQLQNLPSGEYIVAITDAAACVFNDTFIVSTLNPLPEIEVGIEDQVCANDCSELEVNLTGTPPFQIAYNIDIGILNRDFLFTTENTDSIVQICPSNLGVTAGGTFSATFMSIQDANCIDTVNQTYVVTVLPPSESQINSTLCAGENLEVNGTIYDQNNPSGQETIVGAGANGCDSIIRVNLNFPRTDTLFIAQNICNNESLIVNGTTYNTLNPSGIEILTNASSSGCDSIISINLNVQTSTEGNLDLTICGEESVNFNGTIYDVNNQVGQEILAGAAQNGCDSIVNVAVTVQDEARGSFFANLCIGESVMVNGTLYDESNPVGTERIMQASGCDSLVEVSLSFSPTVVASLIGDANVCNGEATTLTFNFNQVGNFDVQYYENDRLLELNNITDGYVLNVSPLETTVYRIEAVSSTDWNCVEIGEQARVMVSNLDASIQAETISCANSNDGRLELQIEGGLAPIFIEWNTGEDVSVLQNLSPGTYSVTVTDATNCIVEQTVTLEESIAVEFIAKTEAPSCLGDQDGRILIDSISGSNPPYRVTFDGKTQVVSNFPISFSNLDIGNYELTIENAKGCGSTQTLAVPAPEPLSLQLGDDFQINLGDSVQLVASASGNFERLEWLPREMLTTPDSLSTYTKPTENTTYQLSITDSLGCTVSDQITIFVVNEQTVFQPNSFSPNGDNVNDYFTIFPDNKVESILRLQVYDRWGSLLFDRVNPVIGKDSDGWDGRINNQLATTGMYVFRAEVLYRTGKTEVLFGLFSLLR